MGRGSPTFPSRAQDRVRLPHPGIVRRRGPRSRSAQRPGLTGRAHARTPQLQWQALLLGACAIVGDGRHVRVNTLIHLRLLCLAAAHHADADSLVSRMEEQGRVGAPVVPP